jgi:Synergist-CTERM protein sorting domain-containing protein
VTITANGYYKITGSGATTNTNTVTVSSAVTSADIILDGVNIDVRGTADASDACAFEIESGATVNLTLQVGNTLASGGQRAGLEVHSNASLTIGGSGSLFATGGTFGAGIGGGNGGDGGTITITGGTVDATGGINGAGIGGGSGSSSDGNLLVLIGSTSIFNGDVALTTDITIPAGKTLTIDSGESLTIPATMTLTNDGTLINDGTLTNNGTMNGGGETGGSGAFVNNGTSTLILPTWVTVSPASYVYDGAAKTPTVTVNGLSPGTDYNVSGDTSGTALGSYTITVTGAGGYSGSVRVQWTIIAPAPPSSPSSPSLSSDTAPSEISLTLGGTKYKAEKQMDGTYLFVLPAGTDATKLQVRFDLPPGASVSPPNGSAQDFSEGPAAYTITAEDGTTRAVVKVAVRVEAPLPVEGSLLSPAAASWVIGYVRGADGAVAVHLRAPFAPGVELSEIEAIRAALSGFSVTPALSYACWYSDDAASPISPYLTQKSASVPYPHLEITFTLPSLDELTAGKLEKVEYWLKADATEYVQTFTPPLALSEMTLTDETPPTEEREEPRGSDDNADEKSGGGCNAGMGVSLVAAVLAISAFRRKNAA